MSHEDSDNVRLYAQAGEILRRLTALAAVIARANDAKLERCLKLSPIDRQDLLSVEEARRRLERLPSHDDLAAWIREAEQAAFGVVTHDEARQLLSVLVDSLPLHGRNRRAYIEVGAVALLSARLSAQAVAVSIVQQLQTRKRAPAVADLIAAGREYVDEARRFRSILRAAGNIRSNSEAILRRAATPALAASAAPRLAVHATAASGSPR